MAHKLDETDIQILQLLQQDARMSHKELAVRLHLTITPIHVRVRRLQNEGLIRRYTAIVDPEKLGHGLIAYTQVTLKEHTQEALNTFKHQVVQLVEVMECYHMNGTFDFLLRIAIADMKEYNEVLMVRLSLLRNVGIMNTFFVMSEVKYETALAIKPGLKVK